MKELIKFEIKKITGQKFIVFSLLLFLFLNVITLTGYNHDSLWGNNVNAEKVNFRIYDEVKGNFRTEKIKPLTDEQRELDIIMKSNLKVPEKYKNRGCSYIELYGILTYHTDEIKRLYNAEDFYEGILSENREMAVNLRGYPLKEAKMIDSLYGGRKVSAYYDLNRFMNYFDYSFSSFPVLLIVLLMSSSVFSKEQETGMALLQTSTFCGRLPLSTAKISAVSILTFMVSFIFSLEDLICFTFIYKLQGFSQPLYTIKEFELSPVALSAGMFIFISVVLKAVGFIFISLFTLFLSLLSSKSHRVFFIGFISAFAAMLMCGYSGYLTDYLNLFNPVCLITMSNYLERFRIINIAGMPVLYHNAVIICNIIAGMIYILCILYISRRNVKMIKGGRRNAAS